MTNDTIAFVRAGHRRVRLKRRHIQAALDAPPPNLALTVEVEIADDTLSEVLWPADLQVLLRGLRGEMRGEEYVKQLTGQESDLAVIACWLGGLTPAVGSERDIAVAIFGVGEADLMPRITGSKLYCLGFTLDALWYADMQTIAKMICVDLMDGTVSVVATWSPKP